MDCGKVIRTLLSQRGTGLVTVGLIPGSDKVGTGSAAFQNGTSKPGAFRGTDVRLVTYVGARRVLGFVGKEGRACPWQRAANFVR
jgi:hypothetical protein